MNVADLELCKELYKLSGWIDTEKSWQGAEGHELPMPRTHIYDNHTPAYDLDYLLEKIPHNIYGYSLNMWAYPDENMRGFAFSYYNVLENGGKGAVSKSLPQRGDESPANAACKLAIELFKNGILTKEAE